MAKRKRSERVVAPADQATRTLREEFGEALYDLSCAISVVKLLDTSEIDWGIREQATQVAIEKLDAAYNKLDRAIVHLSRDGDPQGTQP